LVFVGVHLFMKMIVSILFDQLLVQIKKLPWRGIRKKLLKKMFLFTC